MRLYLAFLLAASALNNLVACLRAVISSLSEASYKRAATLALVILSLSFNASANKPSSVLPEPDE